MYLLYGWEGIVPMYYYYYYAVIKRKAIGYVGAPFLKLFFKRSATRTL